MPKKIKNLKSSFQKAIDKAINVGEIDKRFREIAKITPKFRGKAKNPVSSFLYDIHSHMVHHNSLIKKEEIMDMVGFQNLLDACFEKDVMLTIETIDSQTLNIQFDPTSCSSESSFFGSSYENLYPKIQLKLPALSDKMQAS